MVQLTIILSNYSCLKAISHTLLQINLTDWKHLQK